MNYQETLIKIAEAQKQKMIEQTKLEKIKLEDQKRKDKLEIDQQKVDVSKTQAYIEKDKAQSEIKLKDAQTEHTQGQTVNEAIEPLFPGGPDAKGEGNILGKLVKGGVGKILGGGKPSDEELAGTQQAAPQAPSDEDIQAYQDQFNQQEVARGGMPPLGGGGSGAKPPYLKAHDSSELQDVLSKWAPGRQKDRAKQTDKFLQETNEYRKKWQDINEDAQVRAVYAKQKMNDFYKRTKALNENPPTRAQALSNINWFGKIGAIIHAGFQGYLKGTGTVPANVPLLLNEMIEREYNDLVSVYEADKDTITADQNLFAMNMQFNKDMYENEKETIMQLRQFAIDEFQIQMKNLTEGSQEQLAAAQALDSIKRLQTNDQNELNQWRFEEYPGKKGGMTQYQAAQLGFKYREEGRKEEAFRADRVVKYPTPDGSNKEVIMSMEAKKSLRDKDVNARKMIGTGKRTMEIVKQLGVLKAFSAAIPFTKKGKMLLNELGKLGSTLKIEFRVDLGGGGNTALAEHAMIDDFVERLEGQGSIAAFKFLLKKVHGNYEVLDKVLKRRGVQTVVAEYMSNDKIRKEWAGNERGLFIKVGRKLGLKDSEITFNKKEAAIFLP